MDRFKSYAKTWSVPLLVGLLAAFFAIFVLDTDLLAQSGSSSGSKAPTPPGGPPGNTVPSWVFYWLLGIGTTITGALLAGLKILWNKLDTAKTGLTTDEKEWLKALYSWHGEAKDADGIFLWMVPRAWGVEQSKLKDSLNQVLNCMTLCGESRAEKGAMRTAFEKEKERVRELHASELASLRDRLEREADERRLEVEKLLREQNELMRETMSTSQAMATSLRENTQAMSEFKTQLETQWSEHDE